MGIGSATWVTCLSLACCVTYDPLEAARGCEAYALGTCQSFARCSPMLIAAYGSLEACQAQLALSCTYSLHQPDVLGTGAGAELCGVLMSGLDCNALWNGELPLECLPPSGRRGNGAACDVGAQCASARCWRAAAESATGTCEELSSVGQACLGSSDCSPRLVCSPAQTCVRPARAGQACSDAQPCRAPLYCSEGLCSDPALVPQLEPLDPERECEGFARAMCARLEACSTFLVVGSYGSADACIARTASTCVDGLALPDSAATAFGIAGCAAALSGVSCNALFENALPEACSLVAGARVDGAACVVDAQCASTRCARTAGSTRCGSCAARASNEGQCVANTDCERGLICASDNKCRTPAAPGASCDTTHPCGLPWVCSAGTCQPALELGAACDPTADRCDPYAALSCDYNTQHCAGWARSAAGQACGYTAQGLLACVGSATCQLADEWQGTCRAPAADGGACQTDDASCLAPAQCRDGVCVLGSGGDCS
jgi:hypothetical protein